MLHGVVIVAMTSATVCLRPAKRKSQVRVYFYDPLIFIIVFEYYNRNFFRKNEKGIIPVHVCFSGPINSIISYWMVI